jgi:hypothetical protein
MTKMEKRDSRENMLLSYLSYKILNIKKFIHCVNKEKKRKVTGHMARGTSVKPESRTRMVECPSFKGKVFGSNPNVFIISPSKQSTK